MLSPTEVSRTAFKVLGKTEGKDFYPSEGNKTCPQCKSQGNEPVQNTQGLGDFSRFYSQPYSVYECACGYVWSHHKKPFVPALQS
nr:MAG TPA: hypothetical protein [Caudoviricetes sp.]